MNTTAKTLEALANREYKWGFVSDIEADALPPGLTEDVVCAISAKKKEPEFMLEWRLRAYRHWLKMERSAGEPKWANVTYPPIDYQQIVYYSAPKRTTDGPASLDEVDPKLLETFEKLGIPLSERKRLAGVAVDAVFDSVSVATTFKEKLAELGVVFCSFSEAVQNQLHAAVVELVAFDSAQIKYSTVQNWYAGDAEGRGGIFNFVTKRGKCAGRRSKISWTQVETGSAITWKYPSVILQGDDSVGEFYSVALTNHRQQADTGTKMIHAGRNTRSTIISKGISAGHGNNTYRGLVKVLPRATGARNYTQCDSLLMGDQCGAHTFPYIEVANSSAVLEHEASTRKIGEDQIFYCKQRGLSGENAISMIVNGYCKEVFKHLPMEFAVEASKLLGVSLEGSVG